MSADSLTCNFQKRVSDSNENMKAAGLDGMNLAIPNAYKRVSQRRVVTRMYQTMDDLRGSIRGVCPLYVQLSPIERRNLDEKESAPWHIPMPMKQYVNG